MGITTGSVTVPGVPTGVGAAAAPGEIYVTWSGVTGATSYEVYRRGEGSTAYSMIGTSPLTAYHDPTAVANKAYLYRVRAVNAAGPSADSASDLATMIVFADDPVAAGTPIRLTHLAQLRTAVAAVNALAGGTSIFTDPAVPGLSVKAIHISQLRSQLDAALTSLGIATSSYTDSAGSGTPIRAIHFQELRNRVK
mgnify:FL=1